MAFSEFSVSSHVGVSPAQYGGPPDFFNGRSNAPHFDVPPAATPGFVPAPIPLQTVPAVPALVAVSPPGVYRPTTTPGPALPVPPLAAPGLGPSPAPAPGPGSGPPPTPAPLPLVPPPAPIGPVRAKLLKLDSIKDAKGFLNSLETIQFYLHMPEFSTGHADDSLMTDALNVASCA